MPRLPRRQISTAVLALCALLSLAFAPAVSAESEPQTEQAGSCLEGYVYVSANGSNYGPTSPVCVHNTDCDNWVWTGPAYVNGGVAKVHYYVLVPHPDLPDLFCYL